MLGKNNNKAYYEIIEVLRSVDNGDFDARLDKASTGVEKEMADALNAFLDKAAGWKNEVEQQHELSKQVNKMVTATVEGRLDVRTNPDEFEGEFRELAAGVNQMLDAIVTPFMAASKYVTRLSDGDIPPKITKEFKGSYNDFKDRLNICVDAINALIEDSEMLAQAGSEGKVDIRADAARHGGEFRTIIENLNNTLDSIAKPLRESTDILLKLAVNDFDSAVEGEYDGIFKDNAYAVNEVRNRLLNIQRTFEFMARGDFSDLPRYRQAGKRSDNDKLLPYTIRLMETVKGMADEFIELGQAAEAGSLDYRLDASKFDGLFQEAVGTVNGAFDALINPLNMTADYVDQISKGEIPEKITDEYSGDFNKIKDNINACIDGLGGMVEANNVLQKMAVNDYTSHVEGNYQGIYSEVGNAVNGVRERLLNLTDTAQNISRGDMSDLETYRVIGNGTGKRSENDDITPSFIKMMENVNGMINETVDLTDAAKAGNLDYRADSSGYEGGFKLVLDGINETLDSVVGPLNVAADYVDRISKGNIPEKITDQYNGDFNHIKDNLNQCIDAVNMLVDDALLLANAGVEGRLDVRADASRHTGDFSKVVEGVNNCLDAIICPLNMTAGYVEQISKGEIPERITDEYLGDFNRIKNNINDCIEGLGGLVEANEVLHLMANNDLTRSVEGDYQGIYSEVAEATNGIRQRVLTITNVNKNIAKGDLSDLEGLKKIGKRSENDELIPCYITMMGNIEGIVDEFIKLGNAAEAGNLDYRADGNPYEGSFKDAINTVNLAIDALMAPMNEAMRMVHEYAAGHLEAKFGFDTKGDFKVFSDAIDEFGGNLQAIIADSSRVLEAISKNDLSKPIRIHGVGDFKELTEGIENTRRSLNDVVSLIHDSSRNVASTSQEMSASVEEMSSSSYQIADTVSEISKGAQSQASKTEEVSRAMVDMTMTVQEVATNSQKAAENAKDSNDLINNLGTIAKDLIIKMDSIKNATADSSGVIMELDGKSKQIGEIVNLITNIADQTNLLALNAAIEAARAGEHGRGFAVVADEVRKLAEDSGNAAKQISTLIGEIQEGTHNAVTSMQQGSAEVDTGAVALNEAVQVVEQVVAAGTQIANMVQDIAAAAQEQSASIEEVTSSIEEVSAISEESAAGTEEASAAVEQQTATMQELSRSAEDLSSLAADMKLVVDKFILESVSMNGGKSASPGKMEQKDKEEHILV
ncbi:methyl-accepting chemotaxis protein [Methanolobus vulcani]|uniref:Methyl-accepting chemotaxis protein n=1 Tax=Methanolobus vulcani TaxID=38026 RepID=A0A7Z7FBM7_9EURY|nr:methyl-accepting chemotaxis protein [Methanolobus vulcani]SDF29340.1 methyl-accepting chemotaxis protein [Methanolobus vulcani]